MLRPLLLLLPPPQTGKGRKEEAAARCLPPSSVPLPGRCSNGFSRLCFLLPLSPLLQLKESRGRTMLPSPPPPPPPPRLLHRKDQAGTSEAEAGLGRGRGERFLARRRMEGRGERGRRGSWREQRRPGYWRRRGGGVRDYHCISGLQDLSYRTGPVGFSRRLPTLSAWTLLGRSSSSSRAHLNLPPFAVLASSATARLR